MSHLLDMTRGSAAFASYKKKPWHNLGYIFQEQPSSVEEFCNKAKLDYEVARSKNIHRITDAFGNMVSEVESKDYFTYRTDANKVLGSNCGEGYTLFQNKDVADLISPLFDNKEIQMETAGAIKDGSQTFVTFKLKNDIDIDNDVIEMNFVVFNSFDGSLPLMAYFTPTRVVCNNTLQMSFKNARRMIKIRHSANMVNRTTEILAIINAARTNAVIMEEKATEMIKRQFSQKDFFNYLSNVFCTNEEINKLNQGQHFMQVLSTKKRNVLSAVLEYAETGPGQQTNQGSAWWAYNAVTGYYSNVKKYKNEEHRFNNLTLGTADASMTKALALAQPEAKIKTVGLSMN